MLIDPKNAPEINDVVTIKLVSGEEIVGKLVNKTIDSIYLAKPIRVIMEPVNANQVGLSMFPVLGSVSNINSVQFPLSALVIKPLLTGDEIKKRYLESTTGLVTPTSQQTSMIS